MPIETMRIDTHLMFNGQCREALEFYHRLLGGSLRLLSYGDSAAAEKVPEHWRDKIVHGSLVFTDWELAGADVFPDQYLKPQGFQLILQLDDAAEARRLFDTLAEGGTVTMPLQKTFWSPNYGMLTDKFGVPWEINCGAE